MTSAILGGGPVGAVLFDYGLTLVHFDRPMEAIEKAQRAIATRIAAAGHRAPAVELLRTAVHDRVEAEVAAHEAGGALEEIDVASLERRAFEDIGLHLDPVLRDDCARMAQEAWFAGVRPYDDAAAVLRTLRDAGLRVGVCSNAAYRPASMRDQLRHVGLSESVDAAVFSGEVGWRKPSPTIFAAALEGLGGRAETTVFVGDRMREDIDGAHAMGMRAILISRGGAPAPVPTTSTSPDAVVHSLSELPALLVGDNEL